MANGLLIPCEMQPVFLFFLRVASAKREERNKRLHLICVVSVNNLK